MLTKAVVPALWDFAMKSFDQFATLDNPKQVKVIDVKKEKLGYTILIIFHTHLVHGQGLYHV